MLRFVFLLLAVGSAWSRDLLRTRPMPSITNSLVNLGKMEINFHIGKGPDTPKDNIIPFNLKPAPVIDECLCNSLANSHFNDPFFGGASSMINKILMGSDSFNREAITGPQCCESLEENSITFEFGSKAGNLPKPNLFQSIPPIIFDSFIPKKPLPFAPTPLKPKAIEIFLFPKNKEGLEKTWPNNFGKMPIKKTFMKDIKIVGDKDFKHMFDMKKPYDGKNYNDMKAGNEVKSFYNIQNAIDTKNIYDSKNANEVKNVNGVKDTYELKDTFDLKNFDKLKYEAVQPVTVRKEIGIKDEVDTNKSVGKEEKQKEMTLETKLVT